MATLLRRLFIENFALIDTLELLFSVGLNVLTGETGAGKSILVDAIALVLGQRADLSVIRTGADEATLSGEFLVNDATTRKVLDEMGLVPEGDLVLLLQRTLSRSGGSFCRINGRPATVSMLAQIGGVLLDIHGQHEHQSLLQPSRQMDCLDQTAGSEALSLRSRFAELRQHWLVLQEQRAAIVQDDRQRSQRADLLRFQVREIQQAEFRPGEEEDLRARRERLVHAAQLAHATAAARQHLGGAEESGARGALDSLDAALASLGTAVGVDPALGPLVHDLEACRIALVEADRALRAYAETVELDPQALEEVEQRLHLLAGLKRKYGDTIEAICGHADGAQRELAEMEHWEERIAGIEREMARLGAEMETVGGQLSGIRRRWAPRLGERVTDALRRLGIPHARFCVAVEGEFPTLDSGDGVPLQPLALGKAPGPAGFDRVEFLFSANPGESEKPLSRIASGGELARTMLSLRSVAARAQETPIVVFDEIDAGVGGSAARSLGEELLRLSQYCQVLCVTHLPSIAALAHIHHTVAKETRGGRTHIVARTATGEERVRELARMLGSLGEKEAALVHAQELARRAEELRVPEDSVAAKSGTRQARPVPGRRKVRP